MKEILIFLILLLFDKNVATKKLCRDHNSLTGVVTNQKREFMNCFNDDTKSGKSDLVMLLDVSGSMSMTGQWTSQDTGKQETLTGYQIGKKFITALLRKIRIAFNATRIAIGTFGTESRINFNYILDPSYENTKCKFVRDFENKVSFDATWTNLRGTLNDAINVFQQRDSDTKRHLKRPGVNQAVVLISDGEGNVGGRDATDLAAILRKQKIEVYTIAATQYSDEDQMKKIATAENLFYYASDFTDMSEFARNIRGDPYEKLYETKLVDQTECQECDADASCGCNLISGKFKCTCNRGWYGTGVKDAGQSTCTVCPKNRYADRRGYITEQCAACPPNSHTEKQPAFYMKDCICDPGYGGFPGFDPTDPKPCKIKSCNKSPEVNFASVANPVECSKKVFGTKCRYTCAKSYKLTGSDSVECVAKGKTDVMWSEPYPQCKKISCAMNWSPQANMVKDAVCDSQSELGRYAAGTTCNFQCKDGFYMASGQKQITCKDNSEWSALPAMCKESSCSKLAKTGRVTNATITNNCFEEQLKINAICRFTCPSGYTNRGRDWIVCQSTGAEIGKWNIDLNDKTLMPRCEDTENPKFEDSACKDTIYINAFTEKNKNFAQISFKDIKVTDNSGEPVTVICRDGSGNQCDIKLGETRNIKYNLTTATVVEFEAIDTSNNKEKCRFEIKVSDNEPPVNTFCPNVPLIKTAKEKVYVTWDEARYTDNCGNSSECQIKVESTIKRGQFSKGTRTVKYTGVDPSRNVNDKCVFTVKIEGVGCMPIRPGTNGAIIKRGTFFQAVCLPGAEKTPATPLIFFCSEGVWTNLMTFGNVDTLPDCTVKDPKDGKTGDVSGSSTFDGNCDSAAVRAKIEEQFKDALKMWCNQGACELTIHCGPVSLVHRRRRSTLRTLTIKTVITETVSKQEVRTDQKGAMQRLQTVLKQKIPQLVNHLKSVKSWSSIISPGANFGALVPGTEYPEICANKADVVDPNGGSKPCIVCSVGSYKSKETGQCEKCPPGTYQPLPGQTSCLKCPYGSATDQEDNKDFTSCRKVCQPGEFSESGFFPCNKCPESEYSDAKMSTSCKKCPLNTITLKPGAASVYDCGSACLPGSYSENGVEHCKPCPKGQFQEGYGKTTCNDCPGLKSTPGEGIASENSCIDINDCASSPCQRNGICVSLRDSYRCQCKEGYFGENCEKEVDECLLTVCANNGTCIDKFREAKCMCKKGTGGANCDQVLKRCTANTCGTHGTCIDQSDFTTVCVCDKGYIGQFCEAKIEVCHPDPCNQRGLCQPQGNTFTCRCLPGYTGETCQNKFNFCDSDPCMNGGRCEDKRTGYQCHCPASHTGQRCERSFDACAYQKCANQGECVPLENGSMKCLCAAGYLGPRCHTKQASNFDLLFQTRTSSSFASVHGRKQLSKFTIAFWMRSSDIVAQGTPLSYAVRRPDGSLDDNALVLTDYSFFVLYINNQSQPLRLGLNDGEWHHLAVSWSSQTGRVNVFKDGSYLKTLPQAMQQGKTVPKGGRFVVGEEQDDIEKSLTPEESFYGDLSQLNVYDYELSALDVYNLATKCFHNDGNVVAWSDFERQSYGSVVKRPTSLACDFTNALRSYQYFKDQTYSAAVRGKYTYQKRFSSIYSPDSCAKQCNAEQECHSFYIRQSEGCVLLQANIIADEAQLEPKSGYHLYSSSCMKRLGVMDGSIKMQVRDNYGSKTFDSRLMGLYKTPEKNDRVAGWITSSQTGSVEFKLAEEKQINRVATQGHYDKNSRQWISDYGFIYKTSSGSSKRLPNMKGNTGPVNVVQNSIKFKSQHFTMKCYSTAPSGIALRMELFGCGLRPQGTPKLKSSSSNYCAKGPCQNGGICFDLYNSYTCTCKNGFTGTNCEIQECDIGSVDRPVNGGVRKQSNRAVFSCASGYKIQGVSSVACINGLFVSHHTPKCADIDECQTNNVCTDGCENTPGSYRCFCPIGKYIKGANTCFDDNECSKNVGCQSGSCTDLKGGFRCNCPAGYTNILGQRSCYDRNECEAANDCEQICENTLTSYKCSCEPGFKLNADGKTCTRLSCPALSGNVRVIGTVATYMCPNGYKVDGSATRTCLQDNTWSGQPPTCKKIVCKKLLAPENGVVQQSGLKAVYGCKGSYTMFGDRTRMCTENGWSGKTPYCKEVTCRKFLVFKGELLVAATVAGSSARVQCDKGYKLPSNQAEFRVCQSDGSWQGGNTASCQVIDCGALPATGKLIVKNKSSLYDNRVTYSCPPRYCLSGNSERRCQANGKWSGQTPKCEFNSCCKPKQPANSNMTVDKTFTPGSNVFVKCDPGYVLSGTKFRTCQDNDLQWSGIHPKCTIRDCGHPTNNAKIANGNFHDQFNTTYKSVSRFFCNPGYLINGLRERVCQADGKWSGQVPSCYKGTSGGTLNQKSGTLTCPAGKVCHWLIQVTQGKKVNVEFTTFSLNEGDKMEVYDGQKWNHFVVFTKDKIPRPITSNENYLRIITSGHVVLNFKETNCGGMHSEEYGVIMTPNYPNHYPDNTDCYWTIHRPYDKVSFGFLHFRLQQNIVDHTTIYEGPTTDTRLMMPKRYGLGVPYMMHDYADRWLWVHFHSDPKWADTGFQAVYGVYRPKYKKK